MGIEAQPDVCLMWTPTGRHAFWAAALRAVRTPSRTKVDVLAHESVNSMPGGLVAVSTLSGNHNQRSESLVGYQHPHSHGRPD
jgi:hypothetical protein